MIGSVGFDWDEGNINKNWKRHRVTPKECEEVFVNRPLVYNDTKHSQAEPRFIALGLTEKKRLLIISFTSRNRKIRVISARDMNKKERRLYYAEKAETS